jgi:O-antigen ligase
METNGAIGGRRTPTTLFGAVVALILAAELGGLAVWTRPAAPELSTLGLSLASVCVALAGLLAVAWGLSRLRGRFQWWHLLWLFVSLSGLGFRIRGSEASLENPLDLWALYRVGLMGTVALALLIRLCTRRTAWAKSLFQGLIGLLAWYAFISVASSLWSVYAGWTLYKSVEYLVDVALIAAIVGSMRTMQEFKALFDWNWLLAGMLLVTVYFWVLIRPDLAVIPGIGLIRFQIEGVLPAVSADGVGGIGGIMGIVAFTRLLFPTPHRRFYALLLVVAIVTMILAQGRGAISGFLLALAVVLLTTRRASLVTLCALAVPAVLALTGFSSVFTEFFLRGQNPEMFASLSGRVNWWEVGWDLFKQHPVLGFGAYAGSRFAVLAVIGATTVSSIHNTWLEVLLGTGIMGALPVLAAVLGTWIVLLHNRPHGPIDPAGRALQAEALGILASISANSIFSPELVWHPPLTFLLILGYAERLRRGLLVADR